MLVMIVEWCPCRVRYFGLVSLFPVPLSLRIEEYRKAFAP